MRKTYKLKIVRALLSLFLVFLTNVPIVVAFDINFKNLFYFSGLKPHFVPEKITTEITTNVARASNNLDITARNGVPADSSTSTYTTTANTVIRYDVKFKDNGTLDANNIMVTFPYPSGFTCLNTPNGGAFPARQTAPLDTDCLCNNSSMQIVCDTFSRAAGGSGLDLDFYFNTSACNNTDTHPITVLGTFTTTNGSESSTASIMTTIPCGSITAASSSSGCTCIGSTLSCTNCTPGCTNPSYAPACMSGIAGCYSSGGTGTSFQSLICTTSSSSS